MLLAMILLLCSPAVAAERKVSVGFTAAFLEPNRGATPPPEAVVESLSEGMATVRLWGLRGEVLFSTTAQRGIVRLETQPTPPQGRENPWNGWRHRHGYKYEPARGYSWSNIDDQRTPMSEALGRFYDAHLKDVWKRWARAALTDALTRPAALKDAAPAARLAIPLAVPWNGEKPSGTVPVEYGLRLWGAALAVRFRVGPAKSGPWLADAAGPVDWTLDQGEWRRRHGYGPEHPDRARLDELMSRCGAYWTEVTTHLILRDLDAQLRSP
ncbi:MAG: hypothetical protein HYZ75_12330 [Elusimicrobia bacterium]|nr:hypothetical protein [Elusimicrobiota bacterium]